MATEYTLSIIKPDATERNISGKVNSYLEANGLKIVAQKMIQLDTKGAEYFYAEHKERPFFASLVAYMISAPIIVQILKGENAVAKNREIMGATNPSEAAEGTIRRDLAQSLEANTIHGSDSPASAKREIDFFFKKEEIFG